MLKLNILRHHPHNHHHRLYLIRKTARKFDVEDEYIYVRNCDKKMIVTSKNYLIQNDNGQKKEDEDRKEKYDGAVVHFVLVCEYVYWRNKKKEEQGEEEGSIFILTPNGR